MDAIKSHEKIALLPTDRFMADSKMLVANSSSRNQLFFGKLFWPTARYLLPSHHESVATWHSN
jgi:hypothetical protein